MEKAVVLREWFDRVDAGRTGNITAPQLQVRFHSILVSAASSPNSTPTNSHLLEELTANYRTAHQNALAVGNLDFPLSVVQQMIRSLSSRPWFFLFNFFFAVQLFDLVLT
jgi:hypothetical protein